MPYDFHTLPEYVPMTAWQASIGRNTKDNLKMVLLNECYSGDGEDAFDAIMRDIRVRPSRNWVRLFILDADVEGTGRPRC